MIKQCFLVLAVTCGVAMAQSPVAGPATQPSTQPASRPAASADDASYGIGYQFGRQIKDAGVTLNLEAIEQGLRAGIAGEKSKVTERQFNEAMRVLQTQAIVAAKEKGEKNDKDGAQFRDANGKKKGVTTTASGLQVETITEGKGESPKATDTVKVQYTGTLIDGTKFDSSYDHGEPAVFPLNRVIGAWTEGLQLMKVGGKSRLVVPPSLGYGPTGQGPIPPNATLIFEVELLSIEKGGTGFQMPGGDQ